MTNFLRVTRHGRWLVYPDLPWLPQDGIQGDALLDLQTEDNRLSVYRVENEEDTKQVVIALAANRKNLVNLDYAIFEDSPLVSTGIAIQKQNGETPHDQVNKLHYDLANLTVGSLAVLAQAVASGAHTRVPWKNIKAGLQEAMGSGALDEGKMKPELLRRIL